MRNSQGLYWYESLTAPGTAWMFIVQYSFGRTAFVLGFSQYLNRIHFFLRTCNNIRLIWTKIKLSIARCRSHNTWKRSKHLHYQTRRKPSSNFFIVRTRHRVGRDLASYFKCLYRKGPSETMRLLIKERSNHRVGRDETTFTTKY